MISCFLFVRGLDTTCIERDWNESLESTKCFNVFGVCNLALKQVILFSLVF